jgi:hypothetical protein
MSYKFIVSCPLVILSLVAAATTAKDLLLLSGSRSFVTPFGPQDDNFL